MRYKAQKILAILILFVCLFRGMSRVSELLYPPNDIMKNWQSFYAQEKNSIDVLIVGSSHAYSSFDPRIFQEILDKNTYILATNSQTVTQTYYNVKEALKYQRPQIIILEAFSIDDNSNWQNGGRDDADFDKNWKKESNIDGMKPGLVKLEAICNQYTAGNWFYAGCRLIRCHQNWKDANLIRSNYKYLQNGVYSFECFRTSVSHMSPKVMKQYEDMDFNETPYTISDENEKHFHMLAKLCRENDIQLYVVMAPMYDGYIEKINYNSQYESVNALVSSEQIPYLDCNTVYEEIGMIPDDFEDAFSDVIHLNAQGAEKISRYVAKKIVEWNQE